VATSTAEDLNYEDLLEILDKYSEEEAVNRFSINTVKKRR